MQNRPWSRTSLLREKSPKKDSLYWMLGQSVNPNISMVSSAGFEPTASGLGILRSIHLSYEDNLIAILSSNNPLINF